MKLSKRSWLLVLAILILGSTSAVAQSRIQLVQGRRAVKDKISFIVEVSPEKGRTPNQSPYDIQIFTRFADRGAVGMVYLDGKALGRFDESQQFNSNPADITYGRHTMTLVVASPTVVTDFYVTVRGGVPHEVLDTEEAVLPRTPGLEQRIVELERRVHELEAELATLKKKRAQ